MIVLYASFFLSMSHADVSPTKNAYISKPFLPVIVNRMPVDSTALVEYAHYHQTPFLYALQMVQTQGTAIHVSSSGFWLTAAHVVSGAHQIFLTTENCEDSSDF